MSLFINFKTFFKICLIEGFLCSTTNWLTEWLKLVKSQLGLQSFCWQDKFNIFFCEKWLHYKKNVIFLACHFSLGVGTNSFPRPPAIFQEYYMNHTHVGHFTAKYSFQQLPSQVSLSSLPIVISFSQDPQVYVSVGGFPCIPLTLM